MGEQFFDRIARAGRARSFSRRKRAITVAAAQKGAKIGQLNFDQPFVREQAPDAANPFSQQIVGDSKRVADAGILVDQFEYFLVWQANDDICRLLKLFQSFASKI